MEKGKELKRPEGRVWKSEGFLKGSGIREADSDDPRFPLNFTKKKIQIYIVFVFIA